MADAYSISIGDTFNRWTYLGQNQSAKGKGRMGLFQCACGTERLVRITHVIIGESKSCGCQRVDVARQRQTKHGASSMGAGSAYKTWSAMLNRCNSPTATGYHNYGGRGVKICDRWRSFENFLADMGERPKGKTLDRYPNKDGDYEPGNCRWATDEEQQNNRRDTRIIEFDGKRLSIAQWARFIGIDRATLLRRLAKKIPLEVALSPRKLPRTAAQSN